jgi:glycosyltransferase involved in cell wall biosynthesis
MRRVSIVIPFKSPTPYLRECVARCLDLAYPDFEIMMLPDEPFDWTAFLSGLPLEGRDVVAIPTGAVAPGAKRDLGAARSKADILAFIDDDAYPARNWLTDAVRVLADPNIGAVGGPAVTPTGDSVWQRASGAVFESRLGGGGTRRRYRPGPASDVDDLPSVNLVVPRDVFQAVGGFNSRYWPGEDSKLCLNILGIGRRLRYDPSVLVWHHRRPLFRSHLRQVAAYALHRGHFARRGDVNSLRPAYFVPSGCLLGFVGGLPFGLISSIAGPAYLILSCIYAVALLEAGIRAGAVDGDVRVSALVPLGVALTHLTYGYYFIRGLLAKDLAR